MSLENRQWLLEVLPYVYKEGVFEFVAEKIYSRDLEPKLAVPVLRGLALTPNPTQKMCHSISVRNMRTCLLILCAPLQTCSKMSHHLVFFYILLRN